MNKEQAIKLLIEAVNLAQARGAYTLKESATILGAVESLTVNPNNTMESNPEIEQTPVAEATPEVVETPTAEVVEAPTEEVAAEPVA